MNQKIYHWHANYKTKNGYSHFKQLQADNRDDAINEVQSLPIFLKLYEVFRRSENHK
jgi:iron uptake system EfeUOB component EfeO/EfeM